jgi:hypothetical protein
MGEQEVCQHLGVLGCYLFDRERSCTCGDVLDLAAAFSILWTIFVLCPGGFSSFQVPQKLIQCHYASQGPAMPQRHAFPILDSQPHPLVFFDCFSSERATCPCFHSCRRQSNDYAALRPGQLNPTAEVVPNCPNSRRRQDRPSNRGLSHRDGSEVYYARPRGCPCCKP